MYSYQDFAKAVYAELQPDETFEQWDDHTYYSSEPIPEEMSFCERWFIKGEGEVPFVLGGENYLLVQLSCTSGVWEIFTGDQASQSVVEYMNETEARAAWAELLGE
jgi:hypothetical protein